LEDNKLTDFCLYSRIAKVATISGADAPLVETAFQYGKNMGLAFQFVDDLLDFVSSSETMGKPTAADLKLGLATAPVLFACEKVSIVAYLKCYCSPPKKMDR